MAKVEDMLTKPGAYRTDVEQPTLLPDPEPQDLWCPIISADDHLLEPPALFDRVPAKVRDGAPHMVTGEDGRPHWEIEGESIMITGVNAVSGRPVSEWRLLSISYEEMRRGVWDPDERVRDMELNGVWASLNFPSAVWGFAGSRFSKMRDTDVGYACVQAYNDWMLEAWCGSHPDRLISCSIPWLADPQKAAAEVRRNAADGCRSVSFSENPEALGFAPLYGEAWDPFFAACCETGTVINLHVGSSGQVSRPSVDSPPPVVVALFPLNGILAVVDWIFAKIPVRFPDIKIALSEAGVSWVPMVIERLKRTWCQREWYPHFWSLEDGDPVALLHRNFFFTSIEDPSAFRLLDLIGEDHVMLESDYPHQDSSWPETQSLIRDELQHLPAATVRKLGFENAAALYRHPLPPADLIARAGFQHASV
jgi:predicted TIM-barrel fold metal-dependent hydrolase